MQETARIMKGLAEDFADRSNMQTILICAALAAGVFIVDITSLPLGVAAGVAYVAVVLISLWLTHWKYSVIIAGGVSVLTVLGYLWSEPAGIPWMVLANRLLALSAIWLTVGIGGWLVFTRGRKSIEALQKAEQLADRAKNAKSRFLKTTSDDMRQHLQTLSLLGGTLRKTVAEPRVQDLCAKQDEAIVQLGDLLNSILELCELESGDIKPKFVEAPIQEIFESLQDEFEFQAQAKGLDLNFELQTDVVYSDRELLTRIVRVLVSNAIRYTNHGAVNIYCQRESDALRITVQDSGIGIAPDKLVRIFDEFYRVDYDSVSRNGGLGLGLSIVERSANLLRTKVEVESEPGQGSSFSVVVPAAGQDVTTQ